MATRTIVKERKWNRPTYEEKTIEQASWPRWAAGCELCRFGIPHDNPNEFCTCQAGQARRNCANGHIVQDDDVHVPTFNAAYGGV